MSGFFKKLGKKDKSKLDGEHHSPKGGRKGAAKHDDTGPTELVVPVSKKERNYSISKSGRHKYKNKQRSSVLQNEIYREPASQDRQAQPSTSSSANRTPSSVAPWDKGAYPSGQSVPRPSQPTSV